MCYLLRSCWHPWIKKVREKYLPHVTSCEWLVTRGFSMQQLAGAVAGTRGENFQWNSRRVFLMFKKRNSGRWQRKVGLHLSDRFSWVLRLVDNLPWFYTNWHWVHNRNSGVLGEYLCSAPVLLWIRSTLWTSTWGQGRGLFANISASKVTTVTTILRPSIHPSIPATGSQVRLRIADDSSQASHHFGAAVSLGQNKKST